MRRSYVWVCVLAMGVSGCGGENALPLTEPEAMGAAVSGAAPREILEVSKDSCPTTHPLAGKALPLTTRSHGVRGTVRIVDDCTLVVTDFAFDGKGLQVELYGAVGGSFPNGIPLSRDLLRPDRPYVNAELLVKLPKDVPLAKLDGLSVWCSDVNVSFGDVSLQP